MENWKNLNQVLILERQVHFQKEINSQKLVEFCMAGEKKEIKELLKSGNAANCYADMMTPLIATIKSDDIELGKYLLLAGATVSYHPDGLVDTALWEAIKNQKYLFLKAFVENKCLLTRETENRLTPLIYATQHSDVEAVSILLSHYAIKVNEKDGNGNTALHYNVSIEEPTADDSEIGKLLLAAGADVAGVNMDGKTPEDLATDPAARSLLLSNKLKNEIPEKDESLDVEPPEPPDPDLGVSITKNNKLKL